MKYRSWGQPATIKRSWDSTLDKNLNLVHGRIFVWTTWTLFGPGRLRLQGHKKLVMVISLKFEPCGVFCKLYHSLVIFHCWIPQASRRVGVIQLKKSNYDIIYRALQRVQISVYNRFIQQTAFIFFILIFKTDQTFITTGSIYLLENLYLDFLFPVLSGLQNDVILSF